MFVFAQADAHLCTRGVALVLQQNFGLGELVHGQTFGEGERGGSAKKKTHGRRHIGDIACKRPSCVLCVSVRVFFSVAHGKFGASASDRTSCS